jgi:hypothetical protein
VFFQNEVYVVSKMIPGDEELYLQYDLIAAIVVRNSW